MAKLKIKTGETGVHDRIRKHLRKHNLTVSDLGIQGPLTEQLDTVLDSIEDIADTVASDAWENQLETDAWKKEHYG